VTDLDDDSAIAHLPQVDLREPSSEVAKQRAARFAGRVAVEVRSKILP
jgi:hypothetical protein